MTKYKTYLFDADGTLLDYDKAELQALKKPFDFMNREAFCFAFFTFSNLFIPRQKRIYK